MAGENHLTSKITMAIFDAVHFTDRAVVTFPAFSLWILHPFPLTLSPLNPFSSWLKTRYFLRSFYFIPQGAALCDAFLDCTVLVVMQHPCVAVKPRTVQITTPAAPLSAGKTQQLQCQTWGSVPPARVIWLLDGEPLVNAPTSVCIPSITFFSLSLCWGCGAKRNSLMATHSVDITLQCDAM
jgi:hypothetical protein